METAFIIVLVLMLGASLYVNLYLWNAIKRFRRANAEFSRNFPLFAVALFVLGGVAGFNVSKILNENAHNSDSQ